MTQLMCEVKKKRKRKMGDARNREYLRTGVRFELRIGMQPASPMSGKGGCVDGLNEPRVYNGFLDCTGQ
jgi:hypothetical protein